MDTVADLLTRARRGLRTFAQAETPEERYSEAHLSALRAAAALITVTTVWPTSSRKATPRSAWERLPEVAPELADFAATFAASGRRRLMVERGAATVTATDAAQLSEQAAAFLTEVEERLCSCPLRHADWPAGSEEGRIVSVGCPVHHQPDEDDEDTDTEEKAG